MGELKIDCERCFGFCCVALYFSASEGFPQDKASGTPCINLQPNFRCSVHKNLITEGLKGCTSYDCFGAGQRVAQVTYAGKDWRQVTESAQEMFDVFLIMRQLHEMLWYLREAVNLEPASCIHNELSSVLMETEHLTNSIAASLIELDIEAHRHKVSKLLVKTSKLVRARYKTLSRDKTNNAISIDFLGADLRKQDLRGANLRGACLIAADLRGVDLSGADLIGADLRDADLRGANLSGSIFLTQSQINTAKGDSITELPDLIDRPKSW